MKLETFCEHEQFFAGGKRIYFKKEKAAISLRQKMFKTGKGGFKAIIAQNKMAKYAECGKILSVLFPKKHKADIAFDYALQLCYSFIALARQIWQDVSFK